MNTAIVTGASSGIGLSISKVLINAGYKVYGFGRNFLKSNFTNENFIPVICDLMNTSLLCEKIKEINKKENIVILVNNAGVAYFGLHEELNPKKIHEMITINLEVPLILTNLLMRTLKKNNGFIINISSIEAKKSSPHGCVYGATKSGLTHFSNSLFDEARKYGVKIISIHPDMTSTNLYRNADFKEGTSPDTYITPDEVAHAVKAVLSQRNGIVITDITLRPQKHMIQRK
ncbi:MAG: SDR family oxidoreductase [Clostridium sp.]